MFPMEKKASNFAMNGGGFRIPIGYRFCPTDEEVIEYYLKRKVCGLPLPVSVIPELDVFQTDPWRIIPGDLKEKRFFFSRQRSLLRSGSGIWKAIGKEKLIVKQQQGMMMMMMNSNNKQQQQQQQVIVIGVKKSLVFVERRTKAIRWVMHEYRLPFSAKYPNSTQGDWAVYCLFQKRRMLKKQGGLVDLTMEEEEDEDEDDEEEEEEEEDDSSCSSGVTEVSSNGVESTDEEEITSGLGFSFKA